MNNLAHGLAQLCRHNRDGSHATQANRSKGLKAIAADLYELGYKIESPNSLKPKHVHSLVTHWRARGLSSTTVKNRVAWMRWWAEKVNKASVIPRDNVELGIEPSPAANDNRAWTLEAGRELPCEYANATLKLIEAFGLRVEEAIKIRPAQADKGVLLELQGSWTKGGRRRQLPISTEKQVEALAYAIEIAGNGSLIPADKSFIQQRKSFDHQTLKAGLRNLHGLRHAFAQQRYVELTGWPSPKAGGPSKSSLTPSELKLDRWARKIISEELGHSRIGITKVYIG